MNRIIRLAAMAATITLLALSSATGARAQTAIQNVVIVHGALADGSGWRQVHDILKQKGYRVTVVQPPQTSLQEDVTATKRILDLQNGPSLLVGHSYGGMVITEAGNAANVAGLVYIAAFQPDNGENLLDLANRIAPATTGIKATADGFLYLDPAVFAADFAADIPPAEAEFMANSQVFPAKIAFEARITEAAWKNRRSWALIPRDDRAINPELMRQMAARAGSDTVEVAGSHAVFMSQPAAVAEVIEKAAQALSR